MAVSGVQRAASTSQSGRKADTTAAAGLQDQFMQILLAQLRYQDPMSPMQERDFFGQMAQFTSATQMENLNGKMDQVMLMMGKSQASQELLAAARLIGSKFQAMNGDELIEGVVDAALVVDGGVFVKSGDVLVPVENLVSIGGAADAGQAG